MQVSHLLPKILSRGIRFLPRILTKTAARLPVVAVAAVIIAVAYAIVGEEKS